MSVASSSPRRQRKALYVAHTFERRLRMTAPLSRELRARFHARSLPLRKGDTVRVLAGSFAGREERVAKVHRRDYTVTLDNVTLKTADEKLKPLSISVGHLVITRLNLSDPWRRRSLRVREEDLTPEERGEAPEGEEAAEASPAEAGPPSPPPEPEAPAEAEGDEELSPPEEGEAAAEAEKPPRKSHAKTKPAEDEEDE